MSIVALKRKVDATFRTASTGGTRFSLAGGHRSQGYVGQGVASRHFSLSNNGQVSTERPAVPKPTVGNYPSPGVNSSAASCLAPATAASRRATCRATVFKAPLFASQEDYLSALADTSLSCAAPSLPQEPGEFCRDRCIKSSPPVFQHRPNVVGATALRQASYDDYVRKKRGAAKHCAPQAARKVMVNKISTPCTSSTV